MMFDRESRGLNVFEEDMVEIGGMKVNGGKIREGLKMMVEREKGIGGMVGGIVKGVVVEYEGGDKVEGKRGVCGFMELVGDCRVMGEKVEYECYIVE